MSQDVLEQSITALKSLRNEDSARSLRSEQVEVEADFLMQGTPILKEETIHACIGLSIKLKDILFGFYTIEKLTGEPGVKIMREKLDEALMFISYVGLMLADYMTGEEKAELRKFRESLDSHPLIQ